MGLTAPTTDQNRFGPNAHATDYPPVFVIGEAPESFDPFRWHENLYIVGQSHVPARLGPGLAALHLDGAGVFEGRFCTAPSNLAGIDLGREQLVDRFGDTARGAMALYVTDSHRRDLLLLPDQMSAAVVYTYRGPSVAACSTSLRALARALRAMNITLTKSPDFFLELLASEAGGHTASSYVEIDAAPLHSFMTLGRRGMTATRYSNFQELYQPDLDYQEQLAIAAEEIVENAALSATHPGTLTSHLTAGADSRLVGAALHAAGVDKKFVFFCGENAVTREQLVARRIAGHMGWTMTRHPGTAAAFTIPGAMQTRQATIEASEGLKSVGPTEGSLRSDGLSLTGYNGEALRSFYSGRVESMTPGKFDANTFLEVVWPQHLWDPDTGLVHGHAIDRVRTSIAADAQYARDIGIPVQTTGDYLYFKARNRYFAWHSAMEASRYRPQFAPLYSPAVVRLAMSVPLQDRLSGRITFDLYRRLAPQVLEIPFDLPKFSGEVHKEWEALPIRGADYNPEPLYDDRKTSVPAARYSKGHVPKATAEHVERARAMTGVTAADIAGEERYRKIVRQQALLKQTPVTEVLREDRIRYLTNRAANTRFRVRMLARLVSYLPWYTDASR